MVGIVYLVLDVCGKLEGGLGDRRTEQYSGRGCCTVGQHEEARQAGFGFRYT